MAPSADPEVQRAMNMVPPPLPLALCALSVLFTLSQSSVAVHHRLQMVWTHAKHGGCVAALVVDTVVVEELASGADPPLRMGPVDRHSLPGIW